MRHVLEPVVEAGDSANQTTVGNSIVPRFCPVENSPIKKPAFPASEAIINKAVKDTNDVPTPKGSFVKPRAKLALQASPLVRSEKNFRPCMGRSIEFPKIARKPSLPVFDGEKRVLLKAPFVGGSRFFVKNSL
jgi:hypothetical protein